MERIFYTDISNIKLDMINLSLISKQRIDKANMIKDELKKIQSLTSYLLLRYAFKEINIDINEYIFSYNGGKPFIKELEYYFNITHSNNIVSVVISDKEVGIDCEIVDTNRNIELLKSYLFTSKENCEYALLSDVDKYDYFYQKWVMKEAYFKMTGLGLTKKFNQIEGIIYPLSKIVDKNNNAYFISCTYSNYTVAEISFNLINAI